MIYNWFNIFNKVEFEALDLVSKLYTVDLEGIGEKDILVTKGNLISILYEGTFLSIGVTADNPFEFEDYAVYLDENNDVWLGIVDET